MARERPSRPPAKPEPEPEMPAPRLVPTLDRDFFVREYFELFQDSKEAFHLDTKQTAALLGPRRDALNVMLSLWSTGAGFEESCDPVEMLDKTTQAAFLAGDYGATLRGAAYLLRLNPENRDEAAIEEARAMFGNLLFNSKGTDDIDDSSG